MMPVSESQVDDQVLILRVVTRGDVQAYKQLYEKYAPIVLGFTFRMVNNRAMAEEITQETFWRVWQNATSYEDSKGSFATWMFRIARNLAIDSLRRQKKFQFQPLNDGTDQENDDFPLYTAVDDQDVVEETAQSIQRDKIAAALSLLPEEQRDVIVWTFFEGKTRREIAADYDIPLGTVNTRARLALQKLQDILETAGFEA